ncbi:MAG: hypothetical protein IPH24_12400 [Crocinitomicaceae bacterium]|nr:hypothetical protein [Crocinitomicaceae bacterium]
MKTSTLFLLSTITILFSCAGNAPESDTTTETTTVSNDSLVAGAAFTEFTNYVGSLENTVENIDSAFARFENLKVDFTQEEKDSAFFVMRDYLWDFEVAADEQEITSEDDMKKLDKKYSKYGFVMSYNEGYAYLMPDMKFLSKKFKNDISVELDDYVDIMKISHSQLTSDAGLIIEWSELADRILTYEEFITENTDSKYWENVLSNYVEETNFLLWGLDNSPIIDMWSEEGVKKLDENVADVYAKLIKDDKHKTGKIIADHLAWLESKNFDFSWEEQTRLTDDEAKMYLGVQ